MRGDVSTSFGKYELIERIGKGGMAEVFLARSVGAEGLEKRLVIKRILPELATNRRFIEMFIAEAKIAMGLNHPNIVQIYDFGKVEGDYYLAMELVDGAELAALLDASRRVGIPLPIGDAVYLAMEVARGLDYAHRRKDSFGQELGLVHRDISPENLMVSWDGTVKIVDFGIARATSMADEEPVELKGKYQYMSPEQAAGRPVDHRSDLFSLGVVLFELVCGRPLFRGNTPEETLSLVSSAVVPDILSINADVPQALELAIYKALAREADERFGSAREFQAELTRVLYGLAEIHDATTVADHLQHVRELLPEDSEEFLVGSGDEDSVERETVNTTFTELDDTTPTKEIELDPRLFTPATQEMGAFSRADVAPRRGRTPVLELGDTASDFSGVSRHRKGVVILAGGVGGLVDGQQSEPDPQLIGEYRRIVEAIAYKNDAVVHHIDGGGFVLLLGIPISDEGDVERATRIAFDLDDAITGIGYGRDDVLTLRIGITDGEVILDEDSRDGRRHFSWDFEGDGLSRARSLVAQSQPGEILVGPGLFRRVRRSFNCTLINSVQGVASGGLEEGSSVQDGVYRVEGLKSISDQIRELRRSYESFYGREIQRRLLRGAFRRTLMEKRARGVIFLGRAGVGKSTLVEHFLRGLSPREVRVVRGVASPFDRDVPLASAAALFAGMLQIDAGGDVETTRADLKKRMNHLFADVADDQRLWMLQSLYRLFAVSPRLEEGDQISGQERRKRLFATLRRIINRIASHRPLVLAIDDVHHIDPVMSAFAADYFDNEQKAPVFFVGTSRDSGPHVHSRAWQTLIETKNLKVERLGDLADREAEKMVRDLLESHGEVSESLVEAVLERSGGNPLYIKEVVAGLAELDLDDEDLEDGARFDSRDLLPANVEGLVRARLERLDPERREALQRLSLFSSPFSLEQARAVLEHQCHSRLAQLVDEELLQFDQSGAGTYRFANKVIRETAERGLVPEAAQRLHGQIARHLLAERERHDSALIARHLDAAGETVRALKFFEDAIEEAFQEFGAEQCLRLCDRVLEHDEIDDERRFRVLSWREAALSEIGDASGAQRTLERLEKLADKVADPSERADVAIRRSRYHFADGEFDKARQSAKRAHQISKDSGDRLGMARAWRIEAVIELAEGNRDRALALVDRAIASLNVGSDPRARRTMVEIYSTRGVILRQSGRHFEALEAYETALTAAHDLGPSPLKRRLLLNSGLALAFTGEFSAAKERYLQVLDTCRQLGHRRQEALILVNLGHLYQMIGRYDRAKRYVRRGIELARGVDSETTVADGELSLGFAYLSQERPEKAKRYLQRGLERAESIPHTYLVVCALLGLVELCLSGPEADADEAADLAHRTLKKCEDAGMMWGVTVATGLLGRALDKQGERAEALRHSRRAVKMLDEVDILGNDQLLIDHAELLGDDEQFQDERRQCVERAARIYEQRRDSLTDEKDRQAYEDRVLSRTIERLVRELGIELDAVE